MDSQAKITVTTVDESTQTVEGIRASYAGLRTEVGDLAQSLEDLSSASTAEQALAGVGSTADDTAASLQVVADQNMVVADTAVDLEGALDGAAAGAANAAGEFEKEAGAAE